MDMSDHEAYHGDLVRANKAYLAMRARCAALEQLLKDYDAWAEQGFDLDFPDGQQAWLEQYTALHARKEALLGQEN